MPHDELDKETDNNPETVYEDTEAHIRADYQVYNSGPLADALRKETAEDAEGYSSLS